MPERLAIVLPVYNEQDAIEAVVNEWIQMLASLPDLEFTLLAFNDGSRDGTGAILDALATRHGARLRVVHKPNSGHGPTILRGYREAAAAGCDWLFQIDSDREIGPEKFPRLWSLRAGSDFLIGRRVNRHAPLPRRVISAISRLCVRLCFGPGIHDVNCPFRLMRAPLLTPELHRIPDDTFAPNLILSGLACRRGWRIHQEEVVFSERTTGEVSIRKWKLLKVACRSFWQTIRFALKRTH